MRFVKRFRRKSRIIYRYIYTKRGRRWIFRMDWVKRNTHWDFHNIDVYVCCCTWPVVNFTIRKVYSHSRLQLYAFDIFARGWLSCELHICDCCFGIWFGKRDGGDLWMCVACDCEYMGFAVYNDSLMFVFFAITIVSKKCSNNFFTQWFYLWKKSVYTLAL